MNTQQFSTTLTDVIGTGADLCSRPTLSRLEDAPRLRDVIRPTYAPVDAYPREPEAVTPAGMRPAPSSTRLHRDTPSGPRA